MLFLSTLAISFFDKMPYWRTAGPPVWRVGDIKRLFIVIYNYIALDATSIAYFSPSSQDQPNQTKHDDASTFSNYAAGRCCCLGCLSGA
jgi:hypothetical protein